MGARAGGMAGEKGNQGPALDPQSQDYPVGKVERPFLEYFYQYVLAAPVCFQVPFHFSECAFVYVHHLVRDQTA